MRQSEITSLVILYAFPCSTSNYVASLPLRGKETSRAETTTIFQESQVFLRESMKLWSIISIVGQPCRSIDSLDALFSCYPYYITANSMFSKFQNNSMRGRSKEIIAPKLLTTYNPHQLASQELSCAIGEWTTPRILA